jgi:hypothetical protein
LLCRFPSHDFLLRGNHEFPQINRAYSFWDEVRLRYKSEVMWKHFQEVLSWMLLAAVVDRSVFCVHGADSLRRNAIKQLVRAHQCNQPGFRTFANMMGDSKFFSIDPESDLRSTPRTIMSLGAEKALHQWCFR